MTSAAPGTAKSSDGADTHRAQRGAAKRADRGNAKGANASEATQTSSAVASVTAAPAQSAPTQALGRVRTKAPKDAPRSAEHRPARAPSKLAQIEALLRRDGGAAIADLMAATGWQRHSVHGVLSGTFKTKLGLVLTRTQAPGGTSVYAIKSPA